MNLYYQIAPLGEEATKLPSSEHPNNQHNDVSSSTSSCSVKSTCSVTSDTLDDPPSVEEDADGYNVAAHLEHLIADLTSESSDGAGDWTDEHQEPQIDLSDDRPTEECGNRSEWRARKLFNARLLGNDEKVYSGTRFKSMLRRIIPDQVPISNSQPMPLVEKHVEKYNCGTCHILKLYIVFTLACSIFLCTLLDPCFKMSLFTFGQTSVPLQAHLNRENVSVVSNNDTKYSEGFYNSVTEPRRDLQPLESSVGDSNTERFQNCLFKKAYIFSMFLCLPIYLVIFIIYSCHFVIRYHDFAWFLFEAILLLISSLILSILASFAFDLARDHMFINLIGECALYYLSFILKTTLFLVLSDGIIGLIIAFFTFWKYKLGTDPFTLISTSDREMYEITQILARRQIIKLFTFGHEPKQHVILQESNDSLAQPSKTSLKSNE